VLAEVSVVSQGPEDRARAPASLTSDLVFDVGMYRGEDTRYYLRKGFRVVAFEANPELVDAARRGFAAEIADGRVQLVPGAITAEGKGSVPFYLHSRLALWGTTDVEQVARNEVLGPSASIAVPAVNFARCLRDFGVPHYLKVDIESADMLCLDALLNVDPQQRPRYVSLEAASDSWSAPVRQFDLLARLGYTRFAIVQQATIGGRVAPITTRQGRTIPYVFEPYSSGAFGEDLAGPWVDRSEAVRRYRRILVALMAGHAFDRLPKGVEIRFMLAALVGRPLPGWFDIHAAR
jgi:FkbM family methyltransferase